MRSAMGKGVLLAVLSWVCLVHVLCQTCPGTSQVKVSVSGRRNETGHWISQVGFEDGSEEDHEFEGVRNAEWFVDVEHKSIVRCGSAGSTAEFSLTFTVPPRKPGPGYELFPGVGFYKLHTKGAKWSLARETCVREGAHLAIINSAKEVEVIKTLFSRNPVLEAVNSEWAWIGVHEAGENGKYFTVFGDAVVNVTTEFIKWAKGYPNDASLNNCLLVNRAAPTMADAPCEAHNRAFLCEQQVF